MAVGPLELALAASRLKKAGFWVRPTMSDGGTPAISAGSEVWMVIEKAAIAAVAGDPAAREHVLGKLRNRVGRARRLRRRIGVMRALRARQMTNP